MILKESISPYCSSQKVEVACNEKIYGSFILPSLINIQQLNVGNVKLVRMKITARMLPYSCHCIISSSIVATGLRKFNSQNLFVFSGSASLYLCALFVAIYSPQLLFGVSFIRFYENRLKSLSEITWPISLWFRFTQTDHNLCDINMF